MATSKAYTDAQNALEAAIQAGSVTQLEAAIENACLPENAVSPVHNILCDTLRNCVRHGKAELVSYILEKHELEYDITSRVSSLDVWRHFSIPTIRMLLARGWDINQPDLDAGSSAPRLIDLAVGNEDRLRWIVEHGGARVEDRPDPQIHGATRLLEICAINGTVSTFKFLQSKGAQIAPNTLHCAVQAAAKEGLDPDARTDSAADPGDDAKAKSNQERIEMLRFLVDNLGLDVNAYDAKIAVYQEEFGTPLHYAASRECGEAVVKWLLNRGAKPTIKNKQGVDVEDHAKARNFEKIVGIIQGWKIGTDWRTRARSRRPEDIIEVIGGW
ncbi:ankyrin repeat-containing domain protein [Dactylonectria macrodidyma]|uniref:Ankyrin repeat-containing domain protein n=1 Tax=Dactylonectria macrodidyma TaxID=307937 RepID=A0A9P9EUX0_9HYPO|nr:ankyrin repeat-containing domain protein [Dactylonectria macrodidyma]